MGECRNHRKLKRCGGILMSDVINLGTCYSDQVILSSLACSFLFLFSLLFLSLSACRLSSNKCVEKGIILDPLYLFWKLKFRELNEVFITSHCMVLSSVSLSMKIVSHRIILFGINPSQILHNILFSPRIEIWCFPIPHLTFHS